MGYILKNKNYGTYLKYIKSIRYKHYVLDRAEATIYDLTQAKAMKNRFKHPENWEIIKL
jgi:hypothetical protein